MSIPPAALVRCESPRVEGPGKRTSDDPPAPSRARLVSVPDPLSRLRETGTETRARAREAAGTWGISELIITRTRELLFPINHVMLLRKMVMAGKVHLCRAV